MGLSSLTASTNRKHIVVVFIGLVFTLKIGLISCANQESQIYTVHLGERQHNDPKLVTDSHHDLLGSLLGSKVASRESMIYSYRHGFSGFSAKLTSSQARELSEHPDVVHVTRSKNMKLTTTRVSDYLGLTSKAPTGLVHETDMGSDAIIGIIDSGIYPESKSFNDNGLGPIPTRWKGRCVSGEGFNASICNRKLIGATFYAKGLTKKYKGAFNAAEKEESMSPLDKIGHGTHCASTAAGSFVQDASFLGLAQGTARGSAPKARLASYKVCWNNEQCFTPDILKAMDHAIRDGVDVLSLSLGSAIPLDFEVDRSDFAIAAFHAVMKGIPVVCAGGNDGPETQTISNVAPWIITVAATTMDREYFTPITLGNNVTVLGQEELYIGEEVGFADLVYFDDLTKADFQAGKAARKILFTFQTDRFTEEMAELAISKGVVGIIIATKPVDMIEPSTLGIASARVDYEIGMDILLYIQTTKFPKAKISPTKTFVGRPSATKVARFSSRGPNSISPAILKPDIAAPGVGILAAVPTGGAVPKGAGYQFMSGTSMATPVVSGIVALLKQKRPDWSPAAIRSALVTTAFQTDPSGEPITAEGSPRKLADPFDYGGGLVNPGKVADPGLVYDMGHDEYVHYLCSAGYDDISISKLLGKSYICPSPTPSMLDVNLPSITIPYLSEEITITRTVTNVGPVGSVYKAVIEPPLGINLQVSPKTLEFGPNTHKISFTVKVSTTHRANTDYHFGSLTWTDNGAHNVRMPLSVRTRVLNFKI
ncbi:Subtilisin-like protease 6 [Hirschfeldia incana]|nr:Subtilisin-like protease 6 [Hirschfeldia incana]